jgi:endo-1,4-beta-xylanase
LGTAVSFPSLANDTAYHETLERQFNLVTPENAMKFGPLSSARGCYDFSKADAIVAFAAEHNMQVRGHALVWHNQQPDWLTGQQWTREEMIEILREHIYTVVGHYQGRIVAWDVVNEAVDEDGSLRDTIWLRTIGPEYIEMAFRWAHEADPNALLFYNDYNGEGLGPKSDGIYALVADLKERGVPIDGVGLQMHVSPECAPDSADLSANLERLAQLDLQVHITEMDVRVPDPLSQESLAAQAEVYSRTLETCLASQNCTAFSMWGFTDQYSWIPEFFPGWGNGLIFDSAYQPKPAYTGIMNCLAP